MTNDLVNSNYSCMNLVKDALKFINCENNHHYSVTPRKSLEIPVIVVCMKYGCHTYDQDILCYYPREDKWSTFLTSTPFMIDMVTSCGGKLYFLSQEDKRILQYDLYSTIWRSLPLEEQRTFHQCFVRNEDVIYAFVSKTRPCLRGDLVLPSWLDSFRPSLPPLRTLTFIKKKPEPNSWDCVLSFDEDSREEVCVVCSENYIYFIGGTAVRNGHNVAQNS